MTKFAGLKSRYTRGAAVAVAAATCLSPIIAWAQVRASVDASIGATAASNPYLLAGSSTAATGVKLTIEPELAIESTGTSIDFRGNLGLEKFFNKYDLDDTVLLNASGEHKIDERTTITAGVSFDSSKNPFRRYSDGGDLSNLAPGELPENPTLDPTLVNLVGRTNRLEVDASIKHLLNPGSAISVTGGMGLTRVSSSFGKDYRDLNLGVEYTKTLSEITSVLVTVDGGSADYLGQRIGDGLFVTALAGIDRHITQSLRLSAQLGVSMATIDAPSGARENTVSWAGKLEVCDQAGSGSACLTAARSTRPTSFGGLTTVNSVGLSYYHSLGINGTAILSANYARTNGAGISFVNDFGGNSESVSLSGTYRRKVGDRVWAFVSPSYSAIREDTVGMRDNYQALVGISYSIGKRQ